MVETGVTEENGETVVQTQLFDWTVLVRGHPVAARRHAAWEHVAGCVDAYVSVIYGTAGV